MDAEPDAAPRTTYRHGGLRAALVSAGVSMARGGGPDAVVLREATRRAGVSPNAAYRHFADRGALLEEVSSVALGMSADRIHREVEGAAVTAGALDAARAQLRAVGRGYIAFALEEPGLFRTAFSVPDNLRSADDPAKAGAAGRTPFQLVGDALDALLAAGALDAQRRANAEFLAWSAVHGLAVLMIDGPLRALGPAQAAASIEGLLDMVERGL